jgi:hypothetical protein
MNINSKTEGISPAEDNPSQSITQQKIPGANTGTQIIIDIHRGSIEGNQDISINIHYNNEISLPSIADISSYNPAISIPRISASQHTANSEIVGGSSWVRGQEDQIITILA